MDDSHYHYQPPRLETTYLVCPKCKKQVLLRSKFYDSNQKNIYGHTEPPEITDKPLLIDSYNFLEEDAIPITFSYASQWLEKKGYKDLVSAFLKWAEPRVNHMEYEIIKLVDEDTLEKYFKQELSQNQETKKGEKIN